MLRTRRPPAIYSPDLLQRRTRRLNFSAIHCLQEIWRFFSSNHPLYDNLWIHLHTLYRSDVREIDKLRIWPQYYFCLTLTLVFFTEITDRKCFTMSALP